MITAAGSEPGPSGVGPGAVIRTGCADRSGGSESKDRMGLGSGGPHARSGLAISLAEQPVRLSGEFFGTAVMLRSGHCCSTYLVALAQRVIPHTFLMTFPAVPCHHCDEARNRAGGYGRSPMTGRHAEQDVLHTACSVRETSRRGLLAWVA